MHKKTVSKILVAIIMTSMLTALLPTLSVGAVTLTSITPNSGNIGTSVRLIGTIDTLGGAYKVGFDTDGSGSIQWTWANETVDDGNAPADSYDINTTWTVPGCLGSDAGLQHMVALRDEQTLAVQVTYFSVVTLRQATPSPAYAQEGDNVTIFIDVTGGTVANQLNRYTVKVVNPVGVTYTETNVNFTTDAVGTGQGNCTFPVDFSSGANTGLSGTYTVLVDRVLPGAITNATTASFVIGLNPTAATPDYERFETVQMQTSGWATNQLIDALIYDNNGTLYDTVSNVNVTTGTVLVNWTVPKDAPLVEYTMTLLNATGNNKAVTSSANFTVSLCNALAVHIVTQPTPSPQQRTLNVTATFYVTYPDGSNFTAADAAGVRVLVYRITSGFGGYTASLNLDGTTDYDPATDIWTATWTVLKNARSATTYNFRFNAYNQFWPAITDIHGNMNGPSGIISSTFTVQPAVLDVQLVNQTSPTTIQRKQTVTSGINITWPDGSAFTAADLGTSYVRVYNNGTIVDTVTLAASDYNATSNIWTISWTAPIDAAIGIGYNFTIIADEITGTAIYGDPSNPNAGPATTISSFNNFTVTGTNLIVPSISTNDDAYLPGEYVIVSFNATYVDGSPVLTGTSTITMTAPDGHTVLTYHPVHVANALWQVAVWLSDAQAQTGAWDIDLAAYAVDDGAGNYGPTAARTASFTVLPANVTLSDLLWEIDLLNARLAALESNTTALAGCCSNVTDLVNTLSAAIDALEAEIDSLSSTAASQTSVNNLASTVNTLSSTVNTLQSALNSLSASAASSTEVAELSAALDALETSLASLSTTAASAAELDALSAAVDELEAAVDALSASALTQTDLDNTASDLSADIGSSNTLIIVAIVLALVAAVAAIAAVYIILKKIAG